MIAMHLEGKKIPKSSKLEQTIMANRGMNVHLERSLTVIEVDRKRMLKFLGRSQRQLRAELNAKKNEKFNLMLRNQIQKSANGVNGGKSSRKKSSGADDIERALFTNGLVNSPGVNHRMKRLASRRRILPQYEDSEEKENESNTTDGRDDDISNKEGKFKDHEVSFLEQIKTSTETRNLQLKAQNVSERKPEALVWMTSGICSVINQNAEIKQINYENMAAKEEKKGAATSQSHSITRFSLFSSMQPTIKTRQSMASNRSVEFGQLNSERTNNTHSHQGRRRSSSRLSQENPWMTRGRTFDERDMIKTPQNTERMRISRLSLVKSKIDTNEKQYLMKLRKQSQMLENEDITKKVWEFIGRKPVSMIREGTTHSASKINKENDILSTDEEEKNLKLFLASANKTSQNNE